MSKQEIINRLKSEGYNADFSREGVPTIYVADAETRENIIKKVKDLFNEIKYDQSFAISTVTVNQNSAVKESLCI